MVYARYMAESFCLSGRRLPHVLCMGLPAARAVTAVVPYGTMSRNSM